MEILQIRTEHDLTKRATSARLAGAHLYAVNTRQFGTLHRQWQNDKSRSGDPLCLMTLDLQQIWMTADESAQIVAAIKATQPVVALQEHVDVVEPAPEPEPAKVQ